MRRCADRDAAPGQSSLPDETSRRLSAVTLRRRCHVDHQPSPISLMLVKSTLRRWDGDQGTPLLRLALWTVYAKITVSRRRSAAQWRSYGATLRYSLPGRTAETGRSRGIVGVIEQSTSCGRRRALISRSASRTAALALRSRRCLTALLRIAAITSWGIAYHCTVSPVSDRRSVGLAGKRSSAFAIWTRACG